MVHILNVNISVSWDITPCSLLKGNRPFGGIYRLHFRIRRISRAKNQRQSKWKIKQSAQVKVTLRLTVSPRSLGLSWCRAPSGAHYKTSVTVRQLRFCSCKAPSLTWGLVYHLSEPQSAVTSHCNYVRDIYNLCVITWYNNACVCIIYIQSLSQSTSSTLDYAL
jgi:hypothetical protein